MWEADGVIVGAVDYATAVFEECTIARWLDHWREILRGMVVNSGGSIESLSLMTPHDYSQLTQQWSRSNTRVPLPRFFHDIFAEIALATPDLPALVQDQRRLSYGLVNALANQVAVRLRALGAGPNERVAICVGRTPETVIGLLGILKAGAAFVPLDPAHPIARLDFIKRDSQPRALVLPAGLTAEWAGELPQISVEVCGAERPTNAIANSADGPHEPNGLQPGHLAYVIYTSGSTGEPKGVMIEHRSLSNLILEQDHSIEIGPGCCVLQLASFAFDMSVHDLTLALSHGACLHLPSAKLNLVGASLDAVLRESRATHLFLTPAALSSLDPGSDYPHLRHLLVGGERVPKDLINRWLAPGRQVFNIYGPTEATVVSTSYHCVIPCDTDPPIGRPFTNIRVYVLDDSGQPRPIGVGGELHIGGLGVARGYLNRPELSAERFIEDPFSDAPGARMYRSGDQVRWRADGNLEFLGRNDDQVKIRGFRIELGEIEARLRVCAGVDTAAVLMREDAGGERRLVAYVVGDHAGGADALRAELAITLPEHMLPSAFVRLDALPLTRNGKIDRKALPAPDRSAYAVRAFSVPVGAVELHIAQIWQNLLGHTQIGRHDNFFELGGHSLLAVQVISRLRQALSVDIPLSALFDHPQLADLAQMLDGAAADLLPPVTAAVRSELMPVSFAQQRLWFLAQLGAAATRAYTMAFSARLHGHLDRGALQRSLNHLVERHEALRTCFEMVDGEPMQRILPAADSRFLLLDDDLRERIDQDTVLAHCMEREADAPFDLRHGPLIRGRLLQLGVDDHVLLITQHHIVSDGWSLGVLLRELNQSYLTEIQPGADPLPPQRIQYADFAAWQRRWVSGEVLQRQADFWAHLLKDAPLISTLPGDRPRAAEQDFAGGFVSIRFSPELTRGLRRLCQDHGMTLFMGLLSSWAVLMTRLSGQTDLVIGSPTANRGQRELEGLIGFFVNMLPLRLDLSGAPSVVDLLARVKASALAALQHQDIPFERVVDLIQPDRSLAYSPLFQVAFAWQNAPATALHLHGTTPMPLPAAPHRTAIFDLSVHLWDQGETIAGGVEYASSLFDASTVERYLEHWRVLLAAMIADDQQHINRLPLLSASERRHLVYGWNQTATVLPLECVHQRIAAHAKSMPDAIALICGEQALSYRELNRWAERFAVRLQGYAVGPGDYVAVCMPRSTAMLIGLLAVLKTGAAYVPLDPAHPAERLLGMLEDCAPKVVLGDVGLGSMLAGMLTTPWVLEPSIDQNASGDRAERSACETGNPRDLAYVIFTSGSTGRPKGVMVEHRSLANLLEWHRLRFSLGPGKRSSSVAGVGFDACAWEVWSAWWAGATLVLAPPACANHPDHLLQWWGDTPLDISFLPTALAEFAFKHRHYNPTLGTLLVGGDALRHLPEQAISVDLINNYGPTETTVVATSGKVEAGLIHVGRPIANTQVYLLDELLEVVPIGAIGEIFIAGIGVARGYLNRPQLTAERFLKDPFSTDPDARMYRTGDLGRWRADGTIEIVGRNDRQVKIRGFRIELAEIEARITEHPGIAEAAVLAPRESDGECRLIAYLAPSRCHGDDDVPELQAEQVAHWQAFYDDTYAHTTGGSNLSDFVGWNSSYDGKPLPEREMQEWRADTLARIRQLRPCRVLEIGCGSGLLLLELAPDCDRYIATDFSAESIATLARKVAQLQLNQVQLQHRTAEDFTDLDPGSFDTVIINSVIQYFPNAAYLDTVVAGALRMLEPSGCLFIGDVRNCALMKAFHASIQLHRAQSDDTGGALATRLRRELVAERELLVAPEFFLRLAANHPGIGNIRVLPKISMHDNELTRYRYDLVVHRQPLVEIAPQLRLDWVQDYCSANRLIAFLQTTESNAILLVNIPNPRVAGDAAVAAALANAHMPASLDKRELERLRLQAITDSMIDPRALVELADRCGFDTELSWVGSDHWGNYQALLIRHGHEGRPFALLPEWLPNALPAGVDRPLTNAPMQESLHARLREELRKSLQKTLPDFMIPARFIILERLPLTANGKIDRQALTHLDSIGNDNTYVPARTKLEQTIATIWAEALSVGRVGLYDNFFELGGHSLLAVQVISRLRHLLGIDASLNLLFTHPLLCEFTQALSTASASQLSEIPLADRTHALALSFAQQRLWFLCRVDQAISAAYNIPLGLRLTGRLDVSSLRLALDRIIARHEVLRTTFRLIEAEPVQCIAPAADSKMAWIEHSIEDLPDAGAVLDRFIADEASKLFDLEFGPLVRCSLIRCAPHEHVLLLTLHHILADGWSVGVLLTELSQIYRSLRMRLPDPLTSLPVQYADYAVWQRRWITGELLHLQTEYWHANLSGAPTLLELPTDHPRPAEQDYAGAQLAFCFDAELTDGLKSLGHRHGTTLFMTLLASWAALLSRLSGQHDLVIGTPTANRGRRETEGLIGFFVNTLAVRLDLSGNPSVTEFLARVKSQVLGALQHSDIPIEQVVERVRPERSLAHAPLFQTVLAWQNAPPGELDLPDLHVSMLPAATIKAKFDLAVALSENATGIEASISFATALFDLGTIERYLGHWQTLLRAMVADDQCQIERLPLLTDHEQAALVEDWGCNPIVQTNRRFFHQSFEAHARSHPDKAALVQDQTVISYGQLNAKANQLARQLRQLGVGPEVRVAICMHRGPTQITSVLAVLKAGGAYVPMDPANPVERLRFMVEDSGPTVILVDRDFDFDWAQASDTRVLHVDPIESDAAPDAVNLDPIEISLLPENLAYVIYTSGSTGRPKGVMVEHRSLCSFVEGLKHWVPVRPDGRVSQFCSASFDVFLFELGLALGYGMLLCIPPKDDVVAGERLIATVSQHRVTHAFLTPAVFGSLYRREDLNSVECLIVGGDYVPQSLVRFWGQGRLLINGYGPTETTIFATSHPCSSLLERDPPIGRPLPNCRVYVLDQYQKPVPPGVIGEFYIGGVGVARGYLNRDSLTSQQFSSDPFSRSPGARMYRSGDLGCWRPDGSLEFVGRNDAQVKMRGFRVELGEIEARLLDHPDVHEAAVLLREDTLGDRHLVAYWVPRPATEEPFTRLENDPTLPPRLRAHLLTMLPEYMVPAAYVRLDRLPLSTNGKLARKQLPPPRSSAYAQQEFEAPDGEIEGIIAQVWASLLDCDRIGRHDNFFQLGGHSLLMLRVVHRLQQSGIEIGIAEVFRHPTIQALAAHISAADADAAVGTAIELRGGSFPPVFFVHDGSGLLVYAHVLANLIDTPNAIFGLPALPMTSTQLHDIESMAIRMESMIRAVQASGPYRLAGWSFGGLLAYATSQRLHQAGDQIAFLGMFDSFCCVKPAAIAQETSDEKAHLLGLMQIEAMGNTQLQSVLDDLKLAARTMDLSQLLGRCRDVQRDLMPAHLAELPVYEVRAYLSRQSSLHAAMWAYDPKPTGINVHLFRASENLTDLGSQYYCGWDRVIPLSAIRVESVPGDHYTMMRIPQISVLAQALTKALQQSHIGANQRPDGTETEH